MREPQAIPVQMAREVLVDKGAHLLILLIILPDHKAAVRDLAGQVLLLVLREVQALREIQAPHLQYFVCHSVAEQEALEETQAQPDFPVTREVKALLGQVVPEVIGETRTEERLSTTTPEAVKEDRVRNTTYVFVLLFMGLLFKRNRLVAGAAAGPVVSLRLHPETPVLLVVIQALVRGWLIPVRGPRREEERAVRGRHRLVEGVLTPVVVRVKQPRFRVLVAGAVVVMRAAHNVRAEAAEAEAEAEPLLIAVIPVIPEVQATHQPLTVYP